MFWNRKKKPDAPPSGENRIASLADRLRQQGRIDLLEAELASFDPRSLVGAEQESWYHLRGIVPFQQGNRPLAFERFKEGVRQCPSSAQLRFSLGQEHEFRGEADQMLACFDQAMFPAVPAQYALAEARYAYLWGRTDKGWSYVESLLPAYFDLKILDTHFLSIRGIPFFQQAWSYLAAFSQLEGNFGKLADVTTEAERTCCDLDFEDLKAELEAMRSGDFNAMKERLRSSIHEADKGKFPSGYQSLRLGILMAQESGGNDEAMGCLQSVKLTADDFSWLEDMRLLARCQLANRFGPEATEMQLRKEFVGRQPLLFEPDNAVTFNLLKYQEGLRRDFVRSRQKSGSPGVGADSR